MDFFDRVIEVRENLQDPLVAYGDESMRLTMSEPMYLLGATIMHDGGEELAKSLIAQKKPGAAKMHWREMGRTAQSRALETVATADTMTVVVIAVPMNPHKQERARRKCLETLLPTLVAAGVGRLVLESRNPVLDRRDIEMVDVMRSRRLLSTTQVTHVRGESEPRLWVPDIVLGAYGDMLSEESLPDRWIAVWEAVEKKTSMRVIPA